MDSLQLAEAKARFSHIIQAAQEGEVTIVTKGHSNKPVAVVVSYSEWQASRPKRQPDTLKEYGPVVFADDWDMTDEELLCS